MERPRPRGVGGECGLFILESLVMVVYGLSSSKVFMLIIGNLWEDGMIKLVVLKTGPVRELNWYKICNCEARKLDSFPS